MPPASSTAERRCPVLSTRSADATCLLDGADRGRQPHFPGAPGGWLCNQSYPLARIFLAVAHLLSGLDQEVDTGKRDTDRNAHPPPPSAHAPARSPRGPDVCLTCCDPAACGPHHLGAHHLGASLAAP